VFPLAALVSIFTLALVSPLPTTQAHSPDGWTALQSDGNTQFFFPHDSDRSTFVAIFPTQESHDTLPHALSALWHKTIGKERVVDAEQKHIASADGAPALLEIVATVDAANNPIYRVFVVKQYGSQIASGEFRSDDPEKMQNVGDAALQMLQGMSVTPADALKSAQ
jgi:hypothetical protein